jgi:hypothetical protein
VPAKIKENASSEAMIQGSAAVYVQNARRYKQELQLLSE